MLKLLTAILLCLNCSNAFAGNAETSFCAAEESVSYVDDPGKEKKLLPVPQKVSLKSATVAVNRTWTISSNGQSNTQAMRSLKEFLSSSGMSAIKEVKGNTTKSIRLIIKKNSVAIGDAIDTARSALENQAYRIELLPNGIDITANAPQGLFYGVQTLKQLLGRKGDELVASQGSITDWPNMNLRMIYWDDAHHLEKFEVLKREIRQASAYKINGFALKLEGHFQYSIAAPIVEPHALSPQQYQELTDYAADHFVQLIPYLDAPAHVSFVLKHPEFAELRAFPNSNYQYTVNNPKTYELVNGMFRELINANKGVEYVLLSNDEAYYTGKAANEIDSAKKLGGNGRLLAQFLGRVADTLRSYGRKVIFWGEYPLIPEDIAKLPTHMINGVYDSSWAPIFKKRGIRQLIYTSTQGEEPLFPNYYPLPADKTLRKENASLNARVPGLLKTITTAIKHQTADLAGVIVAGWADAGLHPQTFWLGYATGASMGWNHNSTAEKLSENFFATFYRSDDQRIKRAYELASRLAQFYDDSWEWKPSNARSGIFGNHAEIYDTPKPALDQYLLPLPIPAERSLSVPYNWSDSNARKLELARYFRKENQELLDILDAVDVKTNKYNIEVLRSVAVLCNYSIDMILGLDSINKNLIKAAAVKDRKSAASLLDEALQIADGMEGRRKQVLQYVEKIWYKDWLPLVMEANGRKYLHAMDDVKDHRPIRTTDLSYLLYREMRYPLQEWIKEVKKIRSGL